MDKKKFLILVLGLIALMVVSKVALLKSQTALPVPSKESQPLSDKLITLKNQLNNATEKEVVRVQAIAQLSTDSSDQALEVLKDFIDHQRPDLPQELENKLKTQAIEGIVHYQNKDTAIVTLEKLEERQKSTPIGDRLRRAVVELRFPQK